MDCSYTMHGIPEQPFLEPPRDDIEQGMMEMSNGKMFPEGLRDETVYGLVYEDLLIYSHGSYLVRKLPTTI